MQYRGLSQNTKDYINHIADNMKEPTIDEILEEHAGDLNLEDPTELIGDLKRGAEHIRDMQGETDAFLTVGPTTSGKIHIGFEADGMPFKRCSIDEAKRIIELLESAICQSRHINPNPAPRG